MMKKKNILKKKKDKRKEENCDNLDDSEKEQLRKYEKEGKKFMCDILDDEKKIFKKKSLITLTMMKKYGQENIRIKERKLCMISITV